MARRCALRDGHWQCIKDLLPARVGRVEVTARDNRFVKACHLVENFFAGLKQYRCIATRCEKTARNFLGAIHLVVAHLVVAIVWLN